MSINTLLSQNSRAGNEKKIAEKLLFSMRSHVDGRETTAVKNTQRVMGSLVSTFLMIILMMSTYGVAIASTDLPSDPSEFRARKTNSSQASEVDIVDPSTGHLNINHKELVLPGNGGLDIIVSRSYRLAELSAGLSGSYTKSYKWSALGPGWSLLGAPRLTVGNPYQPGELHMHWTENGLTLLCAGRNFNLWGEQRIRLDLPDGSQHDFYSAGGYEARSKSNWILKCQSFAVTATSPSGVIYNFGNYNTDRVNGAYYTGINADSYIGNTITVPSKMDAYMMARSVIDVHGNKLNYNYQIFNPNPNKNSGGLLPIWELPGCITRWCSTEGLTFDDDMIDQKHDSSIYESPVIQLTEIVGSDGRRVNFNYDAQTGRLVKMYDNNGRSWSYEYQALDNYNARSLVLVTVPTGEKWKYRYAPGEYKKGEGPNREIIPLDNSTISIGKIVEMTYPAGGSVSYEYDFYFRWLDIPTNTEVIRPYIRTAFRGYSRGERIKKRTLSNGGSWTYNYTRGEIGQYNTTIVTGPEGTTTYHVMGPGYSIYTGQSQRYQNNLWQVGQLMEKIYPNGSVEKYTWQPREIVNAETVLFDLGFVMDERVWGADLKSHTIIRDGATYVTTYSEYDAYGNPGKKVEVGPDGNTRTSTFTYYNDTTKWIVGRIKDQTSNGNVTTRIYDSMGDLRSITQNGVITSFLYDSQGNVSSKTLPRGLVHTYSNYKRGVPQTENQPEGIVITRIVDGAGNITSETNGEGKTTGYIYDGLGRATTITYPIGLPKTIAYTSNKITSTRGTVVETSILDPFGNPKSVTRGGVTTTYSYDALGRKVFESYPGSANGISYDYDCLNRLLMSSEGGKTRSYLYGPGRLTVTDERNKKTMYVYRSYGDPDEQQLMSISAAEASANVSITRNDVGLIKTVTQAGMTRSYFYDSSYYLTTVVNPETGTTTYGRDAAGNMTSRKVGSSGTTTYLYDGQNRLKSVTYPISTPSVSHTYYKNNKIWTSSSAGGVRTYSYDDNGNLTSLALAIDGRNFKISYIYDGNDYLSSIKSSSGRVVNYAPDALGRPTQVSGYLNSVTYWPSGFPNKLYYANGTVSSYEQNPQLLLANFQTLKTGGTTYLNSTYGYDDASNLTNISDNADSSYNRTLGYDAINRLVNANGPWGTGSFSYDGGGNLKTQMLGNWSLNHLYSEGNLLIGVSGNRNTSFAYDFYGNMVKGFGNNYTYDDVPNLVCVNCSNSTDKIQYTYDGGNFRSSVLKAGVKRYELYDATGLLLMEYVPGQPNKLTEYIYLGDKRIAQHVSP